MSKTFFKRLLNWNNTNERAMPWKGEKKPYYIWLSEIILQQTRVAQGLPFYLRFVKSFPSITSLANATQQEVLKLWQGLGSHTAKILRAPRGISKGVRDDF